MESSKPITSRTANSEAAAADSAGQQPAQPRSLWLSREGQIDLPSAKTCFVEAGHGFPLVMIHGLMAYSFSWRKNIPVLRESHRVLALDLAGCGHSGALKSGNYGIEAWSRQVEEFVDALGIAKAHFVATSAGGAVALDFAARHGDRVESLVLAAPVTACSRRIVFLARMYALTGMPVPIVNALIKSLPKLLPWLFRHSYYADASRITPETVPGYLEGIRPELTVPMLRQAIRGWKPEQQVLTSVNAPILLVWGDKDQIVPPVCIPRLLEKLPNATVATIPGAGHFCYEELPEAFNEAVLKFVGKAPHVRRSHSGELFQMRTFPAIADRSNPAR